MNVLVVLRSLAFYLGYVPTVALFSTFGFTLGLLCPHRLRQEVLTYANSIIIWWLKVTCGVEVRVIGETNIPQQPFVALSKHQSSWETYYLQRKLRPVSTILKRELLRIPFFGWGLAMTRPIAIDRSSPKTALKEVLSKGQLRLAEGNNVLIYPEGTRIEYGKTGNYGRSGAALAIAAQVPVLPISHNAGACWPAHKFLKHPGTVTVVFGEPIYTEGLQSKSLNARVEAWIEDTLASLPKTSHKN